MGHAEKLLACIPAVASTCSDYKLADSLKWIQPETVATENDISANILYSCNVARYSIPSYTTHVFTTVAKHDIMRTVSHRL